jgi:hypothetical protein
LWYNPDISESQQSESVPIEDTPGKARTWWHPLLVRLLDYALKSAYKVEEEVSVGKLPLHVDILLLRREGGQLSEPRSRDLSILLPLLRRFTLIEFKSPTDTVQRGDLSKLIGCAFLWHSQQSPLVSHQDVALMVLAPSMTGPFREELDALGFQISDGEPGVYRITGATFSAWFVETDVMAERGQPILSLVSRVFLNDRRSIIEKLALGGEGALANYRYMVQQIKQFRSEEDVAMQQAISENLTQFEDDLVNKMLEELPAERRLRGVAAEDRVRGLSSEQILAALGDENDLVNKMLEELPAERRLRGVAAEERVRGLSSEQILAALSDEDVAKLRELLARRKGI